MEIQNNQNDKLSEMNNEKPKKPITARVVLVIVALLLIMGAFLISRYMDREQEVKQAFAVATETYEKLAKSDSHFGGEILADYQYYLGAFDENADYVQMDLSYSYTVPVLLDHSTIVVKVTPTLMPGNRWGFDFIQDIWKQADFLDLQLQASPEIKYDYEMKQLLLMLEAMNERVESASKENCQIEANGYTLTFQVEKAPLKLVDDTNRYYMSKAYVLNYNDTDYDYSDTMKEQEKIDQAYLQYVKIQQAKEDKRNKEVAENKKRKAIDQVRDDIEEGLDDYLTKNVDQKMQKELRKEGISDVTVTHWLGSYSGKYGLTYECYWEYESTKADGEFDTAQKSGNPKNLLAKFRKMAQIRKKYMKKYKTEVKGYTAKAVPADTEENEFLYFELRSKDIYQAYSYQEYEDGSAEMSSYDYAFSISKNGKVTTADYSDDDSSDAGTSSGSGASSGKNGSDSSSSSSQSSKKYTKTYDDGYEDIWLNEDYDEDEYKHNSEYARGVDDAMEEFEDEGW